MRTLRSAIEIKKRQEEDRSRRQVVKQRTKSTMERINDTGTCTSHSSTISIVLRTGSEYYIPEARERNEENNSSNGG